MKLKNKIVGEKVVLRDTIKGDIYLALKMANDPISMRYNMVGWKDKTVEQRWRKIKEYQKSEDVLAISIEEKSSGEYLGYISIDFVFEHDLINFGIMINSQNHGKGYGTEATKMIINYLFENFPKLNRIQLKAFPENIGAVKCYKKAGFIKEGIARQDIKREDGKLWDTIYMGILRSDFKKIN